MEILTEGKAPFQRDEEIWRTIVRYLEDRFGLAEDLSKPMSSNFLAIDKSFRFEPRNTDNEYSFFQVEYLLDHAADLLDRGMRDRAEWNELAVRAFNLGAELTEFFQLDEIHKKEIEAGYYTLSYTDKQSDADAEKKYAEGNKKALHNVNHLLNEYLDDETIEDQKAYHGRNAYAGLYPIFEWNSEAGPDPTGGKRPFQVTWKVKDFPLPESGKNDVISFLEYLAKVIYENGARIQQDAYLSQKESLQAAESANDIKAKALEEIAEYEKKN